MPTTATRYVCGCPACTGIPHPHLLCPRCGVDMPRGNTTAIWALDVCDGCDLWMLLDELAGGWKRR